MWLLKAFPLRGRWCRRQRMRCSHRKVALQNKGYFIANNERCAFYTSSVAFRASLSCWCYRITHRKRFCSCSATPATPFCSLHPPLAAVANVPLKGKPFYSRFVSRVHTTAAPRHRPTGLRYIVRTSLVGRGLAPAVLFRVFTPGGTKAPPYGLMYIVRTSFVGTGLPDGP